MASDTPDQNLGQYFTICNDFIHSARLREGNVLIHCLAGMSRSITVCIAYIISVTQLSWRDGLKVVRAGRGIANPNVGFQNQLQDFEANRLEAERLRLKERFPSVALLDQDRENCEAAISNYEEQLFNRDICEGRCLKRGEKCPTGRCRFLLVPQGVYRILNATYLWLPHLLFNRYVHGSIEKVLIRNTFQLHWPPDVRHVRLLSQFTKA